MALCRGTFRRDEIYRLKIMCNLSSNLQKCSLQIYLTVMQCTAGKLSKFVIC